MKRSLNISIAIMILLILIVIALSVGEYNLTFVETINALMFKGEQININVVYKIRLARVAAAISAGALLATSGYFTRIALKNPLADSSILGVQTGASTFSIFIILAAPTLYFLLPLAAFLGGFLAFSMVVLFSNKKGTLTSSNIILAGVAVNAFFSACIGVITVTHAKELEKTISWLNGSLISVSIDQAISMFIITIILIAISFFFKPMLNILKLDDDNITALGKNVTLYKLVISAFAVLLASISIVFVGIIGFIGIIAPEITRIILKEDTKYYQLFNVLIGAILVLAADTLQKMIFAPNEIPVGVVIGFLGAPLFLYLLRKE